MTISAQSIGKFLALPLVVGVVLVFWFWHPTKLSFVPSSICSLNLQEVISGSQAQQILNAMHDKSVTPASSQIGRYRGTEGEAALYVSAYGSVSEASEAGLKMRRRIDDGNTIFSHVREVSLGGKNITMCLGLGQAHYFFSEDERLYWLAVDPGLAHKSIVAVFQFVRS